MSKTFAITMNVPQQVVTDTLISAFEGGSNYWYDDLDRIAPKKTPYISEDCANEGFTLISHEHNEQKYTVKPEDYPKALQIMAEKYPRHFGNMIKKNGDAETGDVLLQILCFGDVELC